MIYASAFHVMIIHGYAETRKSGRIRSTCSLVNTPLFNPILRAYINYLSSGGPSPGSVCELVHNRDLKKEDLTSVGESALFATICTVYAEERSLVQQLGPSPHRYSLIGILLEHLEVGTQTSQQPLSLLTRHTDSLLETFRQIYHTRNAHSAMGHTIRKLSHVFAILRLVPYQLMYTSSGWLTHQKEAETATQKLAQRLAQEPERARHILIHACQLFRLIRTQHLTDPFDSFFLLMATLYVWFYDRLIIAHKGIQNVRPARMHILRIDQEWNETVLDSWVRGSDTMDKQIHISGIGFLDGGESSTRILREAIRILSHDGAWSVQSNTIARSLLSMIAGVSPSFAD